MNTILVLEDEPSVMTLLRYMLKQYNLLEATSAEQALQLFLEHDRKIGLLMADVTLPRSSGIQVALLLRSRFPHLPVILTSGYPVSDWTGRDYTDLKRLGSTLVAFLQKPFQTKALSNAVCELIGESHPEIARTA